MKGKHDIDIKAADVATLCDLFTRRAELSDEQAAYHQYDSSAKEWREWRWSEVAGEVRHWQGALAAEELEAGARVAVRASRRLVN